MRFLRRITVGALLFLLLISVLAPGLGNLFGDVNSRLELVTGLRFQFWIFTLAALVASLFLRSRLLIVSSLFALVFHGIAIVPFYFSPSRPPGEHAPLRVLSFNVLGNSSNYPAVVEYVKRERPAVAVFQEISDKWAEGLSPLETDYPYTYRAKVIEGLVYSIYPIELPQIVLAGPHRGFVRFNITHEGRKVVILATHAYPQIPFGEQGFRWRKEHLTDVLPRGVNESSELPTVVLGDLNATMWSPQYRILIEKTGLQQARYGFGILPSCGKYLEMSSWWAFPYDHCLVNRHLSISRFWTGPNLKSDHYPVLAELYVR